jgi:hypothetical protein
MNARLLLLFFLGCYNLISAQVKVRGLSFWDSPSLTVYQTSNYLSNERTKLFELQPDSMGIFQFELPTTEIEQLQICSPDRCSWFYIQPNGRYIIELPDDDGLPSLSEQKEVELLFYQLDTLDINYQILGFEAWMDQYLSDIYPLKDLRSNEFITKIRAFKNEVAIVYNTNPSRFLKEYIKYSVGLTIDNFSVIGAPSKGDKFDFYLSSDSINYQQPKLLEFAKAFYQNYFDQLEQTNRVTAQNAILNADLQGLINAFKADAYVHNQNWAEFITFLCLEELQKSQVLAENLALDLYKQMSANAQQSALRKAAHYKWVQINKLKIGKKVPLDLLGKDLQIDFSQKIICLHFYQPTNQKCISEIAALQKVAERHQTALQIITIYPSDVTWTKADQKAFEKVKWPKVALAPESALWNLLDWQSAPAYILIDRQQVVRFMPALGPIPNGSGLTIDTQIIQLK